MSFCAWAFAPLFSIVSQILLDVNGRGRGRFSVMACCAGRNIIGRKPTSLRSTSFAAGNIVHLCPQADNDVLASLEMMLTFGQMMLCLAAQMKKSIAIAMDFLARVDRKDAIIQSFIKPFNVSLMFSAFSFVNPEKK